MERDNGKWLILLFVSLLSMIYQQAIFLLSPNTVFSQDGQGKNSGIQYRNVFYSFKKILVCCWNTLYLTKTRQHVEGHIFGAAKLPVNMPDGEDFTAQIALAMAGLQADDAEDSDLGPASEISAVSDTTATVQVNQSIPPLSTLLDVASNTPLTPPLALTTAIEDDLHAPIHAAELQVTMDKALPIINTDGPTIEPVDEGNKCGSKKKLRKHASDAAAHKSDRHKKR